MSESNLAHIEQLADQLSFEEQLSLAEHLAQRLRRKSQQGEFRDLRGIWKDHFPPDFDIDAALKEIRTGWQNNILPESEA